MKTIIKLVVAAVIINACVRAGMAAMSYYQFKDAAQQAVLFGASAPPSAIRQQIVTRAQELQIPIQPENVVVRRQGQRTWADASYTQKVELFPNQPYPVGFSFSVEGHSMVLGPQDPQ